MLEVKEVFKGHKARFYDEMEQNTAKGDKKPQISFWGIWAENGLYSIILRSLDCKIALSKIFLRFFVEVVGSLRNHCPYFCIAIGTQGSLAKSQRAY